MGSYTGRGRPWGAGGRLFRASDVIGATVVDRRGDGLGSIEDIVLDDEGRVEYVVLSYGGFFGLGAKLCAVPWQALRVDTERNQLALETPRDVLGSAPGFDRADWPNMADAEWRRRINAYCGVQPMQARTGADIESGTNPSDVERRAPAPPHRAGESGSHTARHHDRVLRDLGSGPVIEAEAPELDVQGRRNLADLAAGGEEESERARSAGANAEATETTAEAELRETDEETGETGRRRRAA